MKKYLYCRFLTLFLSVIASIFLIFLEGLVKEIVSGHDNHGEGNVNFHSYLYSHIEGCINYSARRYNVSPWIIKSIIKVESNWNPRAFNRNKNGSYDVGIMQINSSWFPKLRKYGIYERYLWDPCINIEVGTWILAQCIHKYGYRWEAVGCYHSSSYSRKTQYAYKVYRVYKEMIKAANIVQAQSRHYQ